MVSRTGVDVFDNRIFLSRVEIRWAINNSPDVCFSIASFGHERFRSYPANFLQLADICFFEGHYYFSIRSIAQHSYRSFVDGGIDIHQVFFIVREPSLMHSLFRCQTSESAAIKPNAIIANQIRIFIWHHTVGGKGNFPLSLVHVQHFAHVPLAFGNLIFHLSCVTVVEVKVVPVVAFAHPDDFVAIAYRLAKITGVIYKGFRCFFDYGFNLAGFGHNFQHTIHLMTTLVVLEQYRFTIGQPFESFQIHLVFTQIGRNYFLVATCHVKDNRCARR